MMNNLHRFVLEKKTFGPLYNSKSSRIIFSSNESEKMSVDENPLNAFIFSSVRTFAHAYNGTSADLNFFFWIEWM